MFIALLLIRFNGAFLRIARELLCPAELTLSSPQLPLSIASL
jgi:hypothetical protein